MKKLCIVAIVISSLFISCSKDSKDSEDNNYYVSFKKDGTSMTYTGFAAAYRDTINGFVTLSIVGAHTSTSFNDYLGIYIDNYPGNATVGTGQYLDNATSYTLLTTYESGGANYDAGQSVAADAIDYNVPIARHFKVIITEMDENSVRGTFEGDYYKDGEVVNANIIHITGGEFHAKFQ